MKRFTRMILALTILALLTLLQAGLFCLSRLLRVRLWRSLIVLSWTLPFLLLAPWIFGGATLAPTSALNTPGLAGAPAWDHHALLADVVFQFLPWELDVRRAFAAGRLPFWSDLADGGSSPWANPQAGVLSPLSMLARWVDLRHHLLILLMLKMVVAFQGATLLARSFGVHRRWAYFAGLAFALGGGIQAWALFPLSRVAAWIPWLALGAISCLRRTRRPWASSAWAGTALVLAVMLLEGHPETALAGGLFAAALALLLAPGRRPWSKGLLRAATAAALGMALVAPILVAFLEALPRSTRAVETQAEANATAAPRFDQPLSFFHGNRGYFLIAPLARDGFGWPYSQPFSTVISWPDSLSPYAGLLALAGSAAALFAARRRRVARALMGIGLACLFLAAEFWPLRAFLFEVELSRAPAYSRLLQVVSLVLALAGALGLQALAQRSTRARWSWIGCALAALLALAAVPSGLNLVLWLAVLGLTWILRSDTSTRRRMIWFAALGALVVLDLLPWARAGLPRGREEHFFPKTKLIERIATELERNPGLFVAEDLLFYPNQPAVFGLQDPRSLNPMTPQAQLDPLGAAFGFLPTRERYFAPFHRPEHAFLDFLNVRIVLSSGYRPRLDLDLLTEEFFPFLLWRNSDALPRFFVARAVEAVGPAELSDWVEKLSDPRRVAAAPDLLKRSSCAEIRGGTIADPKIRQQIPGTIALTLPEAPPACTLLATSIPFAPGWRARDSSGRVLETLPINGYFVGVILQQGSDELTLDYRPPYLWPSLALALGAALALIWPGWRARGATTRGGRSA